MLLSPMNHKEMHADLAVIYTIMQRVLQSSEERNDDAEWVPRH
jgi:hypothetical protein